MSVLPIELVEQVIDELQGDRRSLRSCSSVCKAWLPRSSAYLFKSLSAHFYVTTRSPSDSWMTPFYRFCTLLTTSTRVSTHVQTLCVMLRPSTVADVAAMVVHLPHLRSLFITGGMEMGAVPCPEALACTGRSIEHLCFRSAPADVIPYFLGLFASVGALEVCSCHASERYLRPESSQHTHAVRSLRVRIITGNTLRYVNELLESSALEDIHVSLYRTCWPIAPNDLTQLLRLSAPTVRRLKVDLDCQPWPAPVDLSVLRTCSLLETFTISAEPLLVSDRDRWWRGVLPFLSALHRHTRVVRIVVVYYVKADDIRDVLRVVDWSVVGGALEHCSDLECLYITVKLLGCPPISAPIYCDVREAMAAALPSRLRSKTVFDS